MLHTQHRWFRYAVCKHMTSKREAHQQRTPTHTANHPLTVFFRLCEQCGTTDVSRHQAAI